MQTIHLDRFSPVPLYYQLYRHIKKQIEKDALKLGDSLPSVVEIAHLADVSVPVVRQAFSSLKKAGFITSHRGKGTFVAKAKTTMKFLQRTVSSYEELEKMGIAMNTRVLELEKVHSVPEFILNKLTLSPNEQVMKLSRLRFVSNIPTFLWTTYVPLKLFQPLLQEDFTKISLFKALKGKCGVHITKAKRWVEVIKADTGKAKLLKVAEFEPLFHVESIAYTDSEIPVEYYEGWFRADNMKFYFEIGV